MSEREEGSTRERILAAALPLFARHGFDGTSVRMVSGAAGVNVATLAYHFGGKEGLYMTLVKRMHEELTGAALHVEPRGTTPREILYELIRAAWAFANEHRTQVRLLVRHLLDQEHHADEIVALSGPLLDQGATLLGALRPDWAPVECRLTVLTMVHLVVRYVLEDRQQLATLLNVDVVDDELLVRWLADVAARQIGI